MTHFQPPVEGQAHTGSSSVRHSLDLLVKDLTVERLLRGSRAVLRERNTALTNVLSKMKDLQ